MNATNQIQEFKDSNIWLTGYFEGNPLDPKALPNSFIYRNRHLGLAPNGKSWLHETYKQCIKPYINSGTNALEIGPGRGGWTKCMLNAKSIYTLDIVQPTKFNEYIGPVNNVNYIVVDNFLCKELPENYFDYMFSMGCLCHIPFDGVTEYAQNIFSKLKSGANCFWMIADQSKFSSVTKTMSDFPKTYKQNAIGVFYEHGIKNTCDMLRNLGYEIISEDLNLIPRDPIIHFKKP